MTQLTPDLSEALHRLVDADMELRRRASGGGRFDAAAEQFDSAAEKVAAAARLAGFSREGSGA